MISQIIFGIALLGAVFFFIKSVKRLSYNIKLGQPEKIEDHKNERLKNMLLVAFGQQKMFKKPLVALLHLMVYAGFLIVNIELLEIILDGLTGGHRVFAPILGSFYPVLINVFETFAVLVLVSCVFFLIRRNVIKVERFHKPEMKKWPTLDGNLILIFEIVLMIALLSMNATETALLQKAYNTNETLFFFSGLLTPVYSGFSAETLVLLERVFWWFHILGIFFFANYVMFSKHLHIFLAFPNTYFSRLTPKGQFNNMESVTNEVKLMLNMAPPDATPPTEVGRFGAKDVTDLSQKALLSSYTCTECGRCTAECPANLTGKTLSPRKIMMDTRDRAEELGEFKRKNGADQLDDKSLLGNYITDEEINACTTCNACVEACPVNINPLSIIMELRRFRVMEEAQGPQEWNMMYQNIETSFSPWKFPPTDRFKWKEGLNK